MTNPTSQPIFVERLDNTGRGSAFVANFTAHVLAPGETYSIDVTYFAAGGVALYKEKSTTFRLSWGAGQATVTLRGISTFVNCDVVPIFEPARNDYLAGGPLHFGRVLVGDTAQLPLRVRNDTQFASKVSIDTPFSVTGDPFTIPAPVEKMLEPGEELEVPVSIYSTHVWRSAARVNVRVHELCGGTPVTLSAEGAFSLVDCVPSSLGWRAPVGGRSTVDSSDVLGIANYSLQPLTLTVPEQFFIFGGEGVPIPAANVDASGNLVPGRASAILGFAPTLAGDFEVTLSVSDPRSGVCTLHGVAN